MKVTTVVLGAALLVGTPLLAFDPTATNGSALRQPASSVDVFGDRARTEEQVKTSKEAKHRYKNATEAERARIRDAAAADREARKFEKERQKEERKLAKQRTKEERKREKEARKRNRG